ncbi:HAD-superfamily hydrolase, subfamily IA, variant 3 [Parafrankia sp. EAN1pec]|uniref:HAD family hydrolase n=1 Tax=Parafrankia sp. (strain EAN1pec) TaxID=298653 RepID=UPI0000543074|nr:HAD-superfamily hydrolase, subfamily IA, variant 3 [Frankia sp. EAN1pec]
MLRAILLDFYGTVVTEDDYTIEIVCEQVRVTATGRPDLTAAEVGAYWRQVFQEETGRSIAEAFRTQRDITLSSLARALRRFGSTADPYMLCTPQFDLWRQPKLCADSRAFLDALDLPVCVVSNIDRADLRTAIDHHQLPLDLLVTSEDARCYKPHPAIFQTATRLLGLPPDAVLHIGDSLTSDVAGAHALGIPTIWVNRSGRPRPADLTSIAEVGALTEALPLLQQARR